MLELDTAGLSTCSLSELFDFLRDQTSSGTNGELIQEPDESERSLLVVLGGNDKRRFSCGELRMEVLRESTALDGLVGERDRDGKTSSTGPGGD